MLKYIIAAVAAFTISTTAMAAEEIRWTYKNVVHNMWNTPNMVDTYDDAIGTINQINEDAYSVWPINYAGEYRETWRHLDGVDLYPDNAAAKAFLNEHETTMDYLQNLLDGDAQSIMIPLDPHGRSVFEFHFQRRYRYAVESGDEWKTHFYKNLLEVHGYGEYMNLIEENYPY